MAVVEAGGYSSHSTPSLGTSICRRQVRPLKKQKKKKEKKKENFFFFMISYS